MLFPFSRHSMSVQNTLELILELAEQYNQHGRPPVSEDYQTLEVLHPVFLYVLSVVEPVYTHEDNPSQAFLWGY